LTGRLGSCIYFVIWWDLPAGLRGRVSPAPRLLPYLPKPTTKKRPPSRASGMGTLSPRGVCPRHEPDTKNPARI
jgi:hypothetical protein